MRKIIVIKEKTLMDKTLLYIIGSIIIFFLGLYEIIKGAISTLIVLIPFIVVIAVASGISYLISNFIYDRLINIIKIFLLPV